MLLSLDRVDLSFPSAEGVLPVLRQVSLAVGAGETVAITGPSGSGKTSLLMMCAGLLRPTAGHILFEGLDIGTADEEALAALRQRRMGVVFQNFHLVPSMTAVENVAIPLELAGVSQATARAREALERVNLGHRLSHRPSQLSGGEQQRVAMARAMVARPALILADEPTGNLDQDTGRLVIDLLFSQVRESGASLLLITHDPQLAALCERQIAVRDGQVVA